MAHCVKVQKTTGFIVFLGTWALLKTCSERLVGVLGRLGVVLESSWGCRRRLGNERIVHLTTLAHNFRTTSCHVIFAEKLLNPGPDLGAIPS